MGGYSGADEQTPKQASSARAPQDRAEASSKPAQQPADAGSSEPPAGQQEGGPGRPAPKDDPAQRGVEPAIHSNSGEQLETERAGSLPGISSKDEVQVCISYYAFTSTAFMLSMGFVHLEHVTESPPAAGIASDSRHFWGCLACLTIHHPQNACMTYAHEQ